MSKDPTIGMFVGDAEIERRQRKRLTTPPPETPVAEETLEDESGTGGDEPFCSHGNLLWSEHCDECIQESWALSDAITNAAIREGK